MCLCLFFKWFIFKVGLGVWVEKNKIEEGEKRVYIIFYLFVLILILRFLE